MLPEKRLDDNNSARRPWLGEVASSLRLPGPRGGPIPPSAAGMVARGVGFHRVAPAGAFFYGFAVGAGAHQTTQASQQDQLNDG